MKVVVTGSSGKAGRAVVADLLEQGHDVTGVDLAVPAQSPDSFIAADVTDFGETVECLAGADAVVHLAAIPAPGLRT
jgi:nucleoside-diphosphate-sugar epimerase